MKRFSETKHYVGYSEAEALKMPSDKLHTALWIEFDNNTIKIDESIRIFRGRICTSSNHLGLIKWRRRQYEHHYYCSVRPLGQMKQIVFAGKKP